MSAVALDRERGAVVAYQAGVIRNILNHDWSPGVVRRLLESGILLHADASSSSTDLERWIDAERELDRVLDAVNRPIEPKKFAGDSADQRRAIARLTHQLDEQRRTPPEIIAAILVEAQSQRLPPDTALAIAAVILNERASARV